MEHRPIANWDTVLWQELELLDATDQIRVSGDWIVNITQHLLPALAQHRREQVAYLLDQPEWDAQKLAETIGSRAVAINRLAKDGRRNRAAATDDSAS